MAVDSSKLPAQAQAAATAEVEFRRVVGSLQGERRPTVTRVGDLAPAHAIKVVQDLLMDLGGIRVGTEQAASARVGKCRFCYIMQRIWVRAVVQPRGLGTAGVSIEPT